MRTLLAIAAVAAVAVVIALFIKTRSRSDEPKTTGSKTAEVAVDASAPPPPPESMEPMEPVTPPPAQIGADPGTDAGSERSVGTEEMAPLKEIMDSTLSGAAHCVGDATGTLAYEISVVNENGKARVERFEIQKSSAPDDVRDCIAKSVREATWDTELDFDRRTLSHSLDVADLARAP